MRKESWKNWMEMDEPSSAALSVFSFHSGVLLLSLSLNGALSFSIMKGQCAFEIIRCDWMREGVDWTHGLASFLSILSLELFLAVTPLDTS